MRFKTLIFLLLCAAGIYAQTLTVAPDSTGKKWVITQTFATPEGGQTVLTSEAKDTAAMQQYIFSNSLGYYNQLAKAKQDARELEGLSKFFSGLYAQTDTSTYLERTALQYGAALIGDWEYKEGNAQKTLKITKNKKKLDGKQGANKCEVVIFTPDYICIKGLFKKGNVAEDVEFFRLSEKRFEGIFDGKKIRLKKQ